MYSVKTRILAIALMCIMLMSVFTACSKDGTPDGYKLVACEGDKFRLFVPENWQSNTDSGITSAIHYIDRTVSVYVYKADDAGELSPEEYWSLCDQKLSAEMEGYSSVGKTEPKILGGKAALKAVYSAKLTELDRTTGNTTQTVYKYMQIMARHDSEMYVLIYSAPETLYDSHIGEVEGNAEGEGIVPYFIFADAYHSDDNNKVFSSDVKVPDGMKLISTDERAYRFFVPVSWKVNTGAQFTAAYIDEANGTRTNVSVQMYMTGNEAETVEQYWQSCEKSYKELFASFNLVSSSEIKMDGINAGKYVYDITTGGNSYKQLQAIVKKGTVFYVITYTADPDNFDGHTAEVDKMIENFDLR